MKLWLESTKGNVVKRFEVLSYDPETKKGIVIGAVGTKFETDMAKETLIKYGYKVIKEE